MYLIDSITRVKRRKTEKLRKFEICLQEITDTTEDSDSDVDDIRNIVEKSQSQLSLAENLFSRSNNGSMQEDFVRILLEVLFSYLMQKLYKVCKNLLKNIKTFLSRFYYKIVDGMRSYYAHARLHGLFSSMFSVRSVMRLRKIRLFLLLMGFSMLFTLPF